ncbi:LysR family transcriptional regulator [Oricola cellulosilytica]|uniref:LysR family transcriptional regulator n=1 Tax=Oricola cellulosilytica TaxID=1429082 RepID=A0A4R0PEB9_9HYPH|nr:LysR family transcriptional regulator [Oricola cellulosilytica]TCD16145.1 LysR family transcriptional regulator [Oricola cellulosilytica]
MADIDEINLRRLDMAMLVTFLSLLRHGKATTVAQEMGLTQSSVSHTLARLRDVFGDPLFLRRPHGLEPTARALELEPQVRAVIDVLDAALQGATGFDPARATARVDIGAFDGELAVYGSALLARMRREAPGISVGFRILGREAALAALENREIDLAIGFFWQEHDAIRELLRTDTYRVVGRADHPLLRGDPTLDEYVAADHLIVSPAGDLYGIVDRHLEDFGRSRRVVAAMPQFLTAFAALSQTDLIATVPAGLARRFGTAFGLAVRQPPITIRTFEINALIHRRNDKSALHRWLLEQVVHVARDEAGERKGT